MSPLLACFNTFRPLDPASDLAPGGGEDADEVRVVPGVGWLHRARVVGGDGGGAHAEHPLQISHHVREN